MGVRAVKSLVAGMAYYSGFLSFYRQRTMRGRAVILVYHRILADRAKLPDYSPYGMSVNAATFAAHLSYLKSNYKVVSLSRLVSLLDRDETLPDDLCVITFDDGWRDNYDVAFPLLKAKRLPATIFLTTNFIDAGRWFWEERIKYLLSRYFVLIQEEALADTDLRRMETALQECCPGPLLAQDQESLPAFLTATVDKLSARGKEQIGRTMRVLEQLLSELERHAVRDFLSWEEIEEMSGSGIEFAAHSVTHQNMNSRDATEVAREVVDSKSRVEEMTGYPVSSFAYPYGKFDDSAVSVVREAGIDAACTLIHGLNDSATDRLKLRRIDIYEDVASSTAVFGCRIVKFLNRY